MTYNDLFGLTYLNLFTILEFEELIKTTYEMLCDKVFLTYFCKFFQMTYNVLYEMKKKCS